ncbi:hypothetical protein Hte_012610 [Hypoxylon texense]
MSQDQNQPQPQRRAVYHPPLPRLPATPFLEKIYGEIFGQPENRWGMFTPWVKARRLAGTWREWDIKDIVNAEPTDLDDLREERPRPTRRKFTFESELENDVRPSHINVEELLGVPSHPGDYTDEFFETHYKNLYVKTVEFVTKWFDCNVDFSRIPNSGYVWDINLTPQFIQYSRLVAHEDRNLGGWPIILNHPTQRRWLITGILSQIMERKIFNELLFGADPNLKAELEALDSNHIEDEGFYRKGMRQYATRMGLHGNLVPRDFWVSVDELAAKTTKIFMPFLNVMKEVRPAVGGAEAYSLRVFLQELHYILSYAGIIQVCTAVSPSIFHFLSATPGARMDSSLESQADSVLYGESREFYVARERQWEQQAAAALRGGVYNGAPAADFVAPKNAQELSVMTAERRRGAKVKFAVFPKLTRYIAENKDMGVLNSEDPRIAYDPEDPRWDQQQAIVEGQSVIELANCVVVYYQGLLKPPPGIIEAYSLEDHIKSMGEVMNGLIPLGFQWLVKSLNFVYFLLRHAFGWLPVVVAVLSTYIGYDFFCYLLRQYIALVLAFVALTCYTSKHFVDRNQVAWGLFIFLAPILVVGLGGILTADSGVNPGESAFGDILTSAKDTVMHPFSAHETAFSGL